jgi:hypothetical protein
VGKRAKMARKKTKKVNSRIENIFFVKNGAVFALLPTNEQLTPKYFNYISRIQLSGIPVLPEPLAHLYRL